MGNDSTLFVKNNKVIPEEIVDHLNKINDDYFNGVLKIELFEDKTIVISDKADYQISLWWYNKKPYHIHHYKDEYDDNPTVEEVSKDSYSMREVPYPDYNFWILTTIQKILTKTTDYVFYYEGIGELSDPNAKIRKTFYEFIEKVTTFPAESWWQKALNKKRIKFRMASNKDAADHNLKEGKMTQEFYNLIFNK